MFDTKSEKELHVYERPSGCLPREGYRQHEGYLYIGSGRGGPSLLSLKDLSPVVDFAELQTEFPAQTISPWGRYFLAGTANEAFVLSRDGNVLKEYTLPPDLFGENYTFVEYPRDEEN